jgi:hypothetical protein
LDHHAQSLMALRNSCRTCYYVEYLTLWKTIPAVEAIYAFSIHSAVWIMDGVTLVKFWNECSAFIFWTGNASKVVVD